MGGGGGGGGAAPGGGRQLYISNVCFPSTLVLLTMMTSIDLTTASL